MPLCFARRLARRGREDIMRGSAALISLTTVLVVAGAPGGALRAQEGARPDPATQPFVAGTPLKLTPNAKTYGGFRFAESISYDADRDLYVAVNAGIAQDVVPNDGYISLVNPDGTAHTLKWIGVNRNGLTLNHPLGSDIANNRLYVADIDTIRWFDMATGRPLGSAAVQGASRINDIEVADDGTIYATQTGDETSDSWRVYRITPQGRSSVFVSGAPLNRPNGVAFDPDGNIVVVNIGSSDVLTFSPSGMLVRTEQSTDSGNDGLAILPDGTKYVSSVRQGTVARIRRGQQAEVVASGIPSAASMAYDSKRHRLIIPMNDWNAITIVELK
jgi:sugar lactone lactonase YvrE